MYLNTYIPKYTELPLIITKVKLSLNMAKLRQQIFLIIP